ncbi:hypothetical protein ASPACDRAFT_1858318 [Aspergillus aculeatus ATCC 16872]|uniref:Uncharacterized protein n=1 Tax=Aspergillus aculeatus (strain ATCC 16872 / CBS 172.66 / WB 5094) TaxID=690307 RepID=A0A1L9WMZ3_ASPA1|nr:uncharacterized protein ASPACDRAFT_1858318 [Aspergillus aculeatus ATCC 16872]OJJ97549.1 hypothetical protein ASPACDRAFT_1858318 [Aspergillus aculeatus ATCC 16872]
MPSTAASMIRYTHTRHPPTTNIVKYHIPKHLLPCFRTVTLPTIMSLAYRAASAEGQYPKAILIRYGAEGIHVQISPHLPSFLPAIPAQARLQGQGIQIPQKANPTPFRPPTRSSIHLTRYQKRGRTKQLRNTWHMTICYKNATHLAKGSHMTAHVYVKNKHHPVFLRANYAAEKPDTAKEASGRAVWGSVESSQYLTREVAYGYLPQQRELGLSGGCGWAYASREKRQPWQGRGGLIRFVLAREKEALKE